MPSKKKTKKAQPRRKATQKIANKKKVIKKVLSRKTTKKKGVKKQAARKKAAIKKRTVTKTNRKVKVLKKPAPKKVRGKIKIKKLKSKKKLATKKRTIKKSNVKKTSQKSREAKKGAGGGKVKRKSAKKSATKNKGFKKKAIKKSVRKPVKIRIIKRAQKRQVISLEDIFYDIEATRKTIHDELSGLFGGIKSGKLNTTLAYSSVVKSAVLPKKPDSSILESRGDEELFEREYHEYSKRGLWYKNIAVGAGVVVSALTIGVLWFQITQGYFNEVKRTNIPLTESINTVVDENTKIFKEAKEDINFAIEETAAKLEGLDKKKNVEAVTQNLSEELQKKLDEGVQEEQTNVVK